MILVLGLVILLGIGARQMVAPFVAAHQPEISLSPAALPLYTLRTIMRMFAALVASLVFTFTYATLAAKSRRAEMVLIPILDVLQSVPILGYLSFTVVFFVSLFPGNVSDRSLLRSSRCSPARPGTWRSASTSRSEPIPTDLDEASRSFRASAWQRFWRLEVPFAMPGLIWNMMMSMSGGWFFVVASEAISVGDLQITLPGVGSYVARAIEQRDLAAVGWAIAAMTIAIVLYDQLLFRPMVAWADKFRVEQTASQIVPRSWVLELFRRSRLVRRLNEPIGLRCIGPRGLGSFFPGTFVRQPAGRRPVASWMSSGRAWSSPASPMSAGQLCGMRDRRFRGTICGPPRAKAL